MIIIIKDGVNAGAGAGAGAGRIRKEKEQEQEQEQEQTWAARSIRGRGSRYRSILSYFPTYCTGLPYIPTSHSLKLILQDLRKFGRLSKMLLAKYNLLYIRLSI